MKHEEIYIEKQTDAIPIFIEFAFKYMDDVKQYKDISITEFYTLLQSLYKERKTEVIIRPKYFFKEGGDCDNQLVAALSYFLINGIKPENLYIAEGGMKKNEYTHIFLIVKINNTKIIFDPLPGQRINTTDSVYVRVSNVSDYIKL